MLRKAKETKLRLIQESNMRLLLKEGPVHMDGSMEKLIELGNEGKEIKRASWEMDDNGDVVGIIVNFGTSSPEWWSSKK